MSFKVVAQSPFMQTSESVFWFVRAETRISPYQGTNLSKKGILVLKIKRNRFWKGKQTFSQADYSGYTHTNLGPDSVYNESTLNAFSCELTLVWGPWIINLLCFNSFNCPHATVYEIGLCPTK